LPEYAFFSQIGDIVKLQYLSRVQTDHYAISRKNLAHQGKRCGRSKIEVEQIQDGGQPPSWKYINRAYLSNFWTDLHQIWFADIDSFIIGHTRATKAQNYTF